MKFIILEKICDEIFGEDNFIANRSLGKNVTDQNDD